MTGGQRTCCGVWAGFPLFFSILLKDGGLEFLHGVTGVTQEWGGRTGHGRGGEGCTAVSFRGLRPDPRGQHGRGASHCG